MNVEWSIFFLFITNNKPFINFCVNLVNFIIQRLQGPMGPKGPKIENVSF